MLRLWIFGVLKEVPNCMSIYTRTGDKGTTSLFGGRRLPKSDLQVETYGTVDELSCFIGLVSTKKVNIADKKLLLVIQKTLYHIMAFLSGAPEKLSDLQTEIGRFEQTIDRKEKKLPKLASFVIPGGTETSSLFHICRSICRRAERSVVSFSLNNQSSIIHDLSSIMRYLNRLSDLFFVLAREYNKEEILL